MALRATGWRVAAVQLLGVSQPRVNNLLIGQLDKHVELVVSNTA